MYILLMLDGLNNNVINYFRAVLADITYSARTAISSSLYGVPLATIAFMSVAAGTSLALLVSGPEEISYPNENRNMVGGTVDEVEPISGGQIQPEAQDQAQSLNNAPLDIVDGSEDNFTGGQLQKIKELADEGKQATRAATRAMRRTARLASKLPQY